MNTQINKTQVRQHFSCHAQEYERYALVQKKVAEQLANRLVDRSATIYPYRQALEVGCGTGMLTRQLRLQIPNISVVLTDFAHGMSCYAQQQFANTPVCDADAAALPFLDNSFDLILSSSVYQWLNDLPRAFSEIARLLTPQGCFALALYGEKTLFELRHAHQFALGQNPSHGQSFPCVDKISEIVAGQFEIELLETEFEVEWHISVSELMRNLKRIGAQNASQNRPRGFASRRVMQQMINCYEQQFATEKGIPATYEIIYLLARKR